MPARVVLIPLVWGDQWPYVHIWLLLTQFHLTTLQGGVWAEFAIEQGTVDALKLSNLTNK
jgi:hypothetical protein